ncbi:MAG: hypothetical protein A2898_04345 [Candidatus Kerfeldbacteria bacterium RIFCSPLOWO2_01_FULL_48_11]|uniref:Uncharacterized protein n=1 Tax=Candidatus Kerfeldbacteria bacterium RIFCSPLOWO2_01_FULL_48_11 TaxID=1798543 RepID=A0A1G2B217_9BACT|nr:MAG: hypothetical protein A2898_04345 [Candidatus Kerfeldbacteria bacterium RIFCSPLOWO2_01_FULL_48_11]HCJ52478.1 hypothetical protein [Candidatus Kerfeldbacteria bacterium]HCM68574.1 hypothetical protein [Candidatus Kerfeldbacteria bacterium]
MLVERMREPIRVVVDFDGVKVRPLAFLRAGKRYDVERVNLVYRKRVGSRYVWCFAVSDGGNTYGLEYDPERLIWVLSEIQIE